MASKALTFFVIALLLIAVFFVWRDYIKPRIEDRAQPSPSNTTPAPSVGVNETEETGIENVFEEPPTDFVPPNLPP